MGTSTTKYPATPAYDMAIPFAATYTPPLPEILYFDAFGDPVKIYMHRRPLLRLLLIGSPNFGLSPSGLCYEILLLTIFYKD